MRNLNLLNVYRDYSQSVIDHYGSTGDHETGVFRVPTGLGLNEGNISFTVIASSGDGWDHVSVSLPHRCPKWDEMEYIKRMFFKENEVAMQLHVPPKDHVNIHAFCLHLWRPIDKEIPLPPSIMVG